MFQEIVGLLLSLIFNAIMLTAAYKIFQIGNDMREIKELLRDIRRNTGESEPTPAAQSAPSAGPMSLESAEALLREVTYEHPAAPLPGEKAR